MASRLEDSPEPMTGGDDYRASVAGGHAIAEIAGGNIYLAMSLRNVGAGIRVRETITVHLLYSDHEGGQRTITRFNVSPSVDRAWLCSAILHWNLDRADPR